MKQLFKFLTVILLVFSAAGCSNTDIKVLSFNIRVSSSDEFDGENSWVYRKDAVVKFINEEKPDLIGLQEALKRQGDYLEVALKDYTKYCVGRIDGIENGNSESCAVFFKTDRFTIIKEDAFWLSETPQVPSKGWDGAYHRVVTWVHLKDKISKKDVFFFNTHFDHIGRTARIESGKLLTDRIMQLTSSIPDAVVFITGDFNGTIDDECMNPIVEKFGYARTDATTNDCETATFNNWGKSGSIIDHIFYINAKALKYRVITKDYGVPYISDHYPVIFEAEL